MVPLEWRPCGQRSGRLHDVAANRKGIGMDWETAYEDLNWFNETISTGDYDLRKAVAEVVSKLPPDVQEFVQWGVWWFTMSAGKFGLAFPVSIPVGHVPDDKQVTRHVIMLSPDLCKESYERAMFTSAHEIAHSWLGHGVVKSEEDFDAQEAEADALAAEWGFPRPHEEEGQKS